MGNVMRVFARDLKRLVTTPAAWLVVIFLATLPSLYTWFNVAGFWNPYDNTGNLRVCIVNEDAGASVEGIGELNVGEQVVGQLAQNDQLGWAFMSRDEAQEEVSAGRAYAAFVMPEDFSSSIASLVTGQFHRPVIEYYVNEKVGPVAPKITDTGANSLDATINETFVSVASETVASALDDKIAEATEKSREAKSDAVAKVKAAQAGISEARQGLSEFTEAAGTAQSDIADAKSMLADAENQLDQLSSGLSLISDLSANADSSLLDFTSKASTTLDEGSRLASQSSARTSTSIAKDASTLLAAKGTVDGALSNGQAIAQQTAGIATQLEDLAKQVPGSIDTTALAEAIAKLEQVNEAAQTNLDGFKQLSDDIGNTAESVSSASGTLDSAVQQTLGGADGFRSTLNTSTIPSISQMLARTSKTVSDLSAAASGQKALVDQAQSVLDELSGALNTAAEALAATDRKLADLQAELDALSADLAGLASSSALAQLVGSDRIDPETLADFMRSPTRLVTEELYPLNAYGSAMAPLFINLTLWIGVFMLMVIMRLEVDDEGVKRLSIPQRFFGRYLLLGLVACAQAAICCTGCIALGVQTANTAAFYLTAIIASLAYLSIQYALSTTLQHVGKALCVILVFVQIPGATGLYPIEMTPEFFHVAYPLFPFTYGINAMRETISGFYDGQWLGCIGVLLAFLAAFMLIGSVVRPYLTNLNRMFAREIEESDIIVGEAVELPARRWRVTQVIEALSGSEEYRYALESRVERFMGLYGQLKQGALGVGIIVPLVVTAVLVPLGAEKVVVLTSWLIWLCALSAFFIVVEFIRDSLSHQVSLEGIDLDEARTLFNGKELFTRVKPLAKDAGKADAPAEAARASGAGDRGDEAAAGPEATDAPAGTAVPADESSPEPSGEGGAR